MLCAPLARAQSPEAESLFDQADTLEKSGKLAEACEAFEASNRIEARAGTLIRLGDCRERIHQIASAWSAYKDALTRVKDIKKREIATNKVADLAPRLSYLTINVPAASQIAGLEVTRNGHALDPAEWNHALPLDGATYAIEAHAPGHVAWKGSATIPEERGQITIDVPALAEEPHAPAVVTAPAIVTAPAPVPASTSTWTGKRKAAVVAVGVAVVAGIGGVVLGEMAKGKQNDADKLCPQMICATAGDMMTASGDIATGQSRALDADIAFGVAGAAAITAGVLWLTGAPETQAVAVTATRGSTVFSISGRF